MTVERSAPRWGRRTLLKAGLAGIVPLLAACSSPSSLMPVASSGSRSQSAVPARATSPPETPTPLPQPTATPIPLPKVPVNVVIWAYKPEIVQESLASWATEYQQPKSNLIVVDGMLDYGDVVTAKFIAGERIDFLYAQEDLVNKWYKPGWIRALDDVPFVKDGLLAQEYPWGKQSQSAYDGHLVGLPYWSGGRTLYLNLEMADKLGIKPATTWADFMNHLALAQQKGISYPLAPTWAKDYWNMGQSIFTEAYSDGVYIFKSAESIELDLKGNAGFSALLARWKEIYDKKYVPPDAFSRGITAGYAPTTFPSGNFLYGWADDYNAIDWQDPKTSKIAGKFTNLLNPGKTHQALIAAPMYCLGTLHDVPDDVLFSLAQFFAYIDPQTHDYTVAKKWATGTGLGTNNKQLMSDPSVLAAWKPWRNVETYAQFFQHGLPKEAQKQLWYRSWEAGFLSEIQDYLAGKLTEAKLIQNAYDSQARLRVQYPDIT